MAEQLGLPVISPYAGGHIDRTARFAFSDSRIELGRRWDLHGPVALVIGCNPSNASDTRDDPTCSWWINWFRDNGFAAFRAFNLYPFITSSPAECRRRAAWHETNDWYARDALHHNLSELCKATAEAEQVFVCWGAIAWDDGWIDHVMEEIACDGGNPALWCWGFNKDGSPKHPMARGVHRIPKGQKALIWRRSAT